MVLAAGSGPIEDVRRAPDNVLCFVEAMKDVFWDAKQRTHTNGDDLVPSIRIHTERFEPEGHKLHGRNPVQNIPGYCSHFQEGPRRAHHGYG
jgi:hypothetical protein